jgi:hypothetical protein
MLLQAQMRLLKQHADDLLDSILNHPNLTEPQIHQMDTRQKEELRLRVKAADDVSQPAHVTECTLYVDTRSEVMQTLQYACAMQS